MPIQQMLLGVGAKKKTYMDDVFSTYIWKGTGSDQTINTGLDMAGEGGMVWVKNRSASKNHAIVDTVRGAGYFLESNTSDPNYDYPITGANPRNLNSFTSTGFTLKSDDGNQYFNWPTGDPKYTSWSFRKAPGFFDIVTWTGNSDTNQTISHSLKSIPGMIIAKRTDSSTTGDWVVYHRDHVGYLKLNSSNGAVSDSGAWTPVTSTSFKAYDYINVNGASYVAYIFSGGESDAATARSVDFDGNSDYLTVPASSDFDFGTGAYTIEFWVKTTTANAGWIFFNSASTGNWYGMRLGIFSGKAEFNEQVNDTDNVVTATTRIDNGTWNHVAVCRGASGDTSKIYINGTLEGEGAANRNFDNNNNVIIGARTSGSSEFTGSISNLRVVKGTAVYTSSFRPPTEPLTNITNTKLLCCNNSSVTGSTVTPGTITSNGNPTASTDSPFDDPAGFAFGDAGDQNVIKCGSYVGNGSSTGPEINLGFEPQWLLVKNASSGSTGWTILDNMRGIITGANEYEIYANSSDAETNTNGNRMSLTPTGFELKDTASYFNASGNTYVFCAIRRSDGYVGKPAEAGTDVFTMVYGNSAGTNPSFVTNFPVDFAINRTPTGSEGWYTTSRLTGTKYMITNGTDAEANASTFKFDHNTGWRTGSAVAAYLSWNWKRHAGFDVVTYLGDGASSRTFAHSLGRTPEMMWLKGRGPNVANWYVYHKDLDNPNRRVLHLETTDGQTSESTARFNDTSPTATHFTIGVNSNNNNDKHMVMLFSSVEGISKVGKYNGSSSAVTLDLGFQPRFIVIKRYNSGSKGWYVFDTARGINAGNDPYMEFNSSAAQVNTQDWVDLTSNGITINHGMSGGHAINDNGDSYVYYAHA